MNTNWRKPMPRFEETMLAQAIVAQNVGDPRMQDRPRAIKMRQDRVLVLQPNFLHQGRAAVVGELITVDSDLAADLCKRGLCEASP